MRLFLLWKNHSTNQLRLEHTYCSICGKEFATKWGLTRHERTHNECHKLQCSICQRTFSNRSYYEGHINNHHGLKPHACLKCNARYALSRVFCVTQCAVVKSKPVKLTLYISAIFASKDLQEKMAFKITSMVNTKALCDTHALTAKHASNGDHHVIDI